MNSLKTFFEPKAAWLGALLIASLGSGCLTGKSSTSFELFNGKDLTGWKITDFAGSGAIEVKNGEIHFAQASSLAASTSPTKTSHALISNLRPKR